MSSKRKEDAKEENANRTGMMESKSEDLGLEVWFQIRGKRAPEEEVDGKRVVVMEADEPKVTTPYSIFVKNNSDRELHVRLDTDAARGMRSYIVRKSQTKEYESFNGMLLGFLPIIVRKGVGLSDPASQVPPEFRHFCFQVKTVNQGPLRWKPPIIWNGDEGNDAFGSISGGVSEDGQPGKKRVKLVSAGRAPDENGCNSSKYKGAMLGQFKLYYASVMEMAEARDRRHKKEKQAMSRAQLTVVKTEPDDSGGASGVKIRPQKKAKVTVIVDLISDSEEEVI